MYYNDYINFNLKNIIKSKNFRFEFVSLDELNIRPIISQKNWAHFSTDPFLSTMTKDKFLLGQDILEHGMYYPFIACYIDNKAYVMEGNHRIQSLKLLKNNGIIKEDKKFLCLFIEDKDLCQNNYNILLKTPVYLRHNIHAEYCDEILNNQISLNTLKEKIKNEGGVFINDYTYEKLATKVSDVIMTTHYYPLWIRDLIYYYKDEYP